MEFTGVDNLIRLISFGGNSGTRVGRLRPPSTLTQPSAYRCLFPHLASYAHFLPVLGRGPTMSARSEMFGDGSISRQKTLGMTG